MTPEIKIITTPFVLHVSVNCYLIRCGDGYVLIDSALRRQRKTVEQALESAGCQPGNLKLIVLTHGDFDHCGNAAHLRQKFGAEIAMHDGDLGMVTQGDMFWNRKQPNALIKTMFGAFFRLSESDRFTPDITLTDGCDLLAHGFDARIVHLPGHSKGNVGILTAEGDLFCGDLLGNLGKPAVWSLIDDAADTKASVAKLRCLPIRMVYPGHGRPFPIEQFMQNHQADH
jgi:hydroxyacylglutathione hydrolase